MSFQTTVLTIAIIIFVILMIIIASMMTSAKSNTQYPPQLGECPDFWQKLPDGKCLNVQNLGNNCAPNPINFNDMDTKQKYDYAKGCNITWDGITNSETKDGQERYA